MQMMHGHSANTCVNKLQHLTKLFNFSAKTSAAVRGFGQFDACHQRSTKGVWVERDTGGRGGTHRLTVRAGWAFVARQSMGALQGQNICSNIGTVQAGL